MESARYGTEATRARTSCWPRSTAARSSSPPSTATGASPSRRSRRASTASRSSGRPRSASRRYSRRWRTTPRSRRRASGCSATTPTARSRRHSNGWADVSTTQPILRRLDEIDWGPRQDVRRLLETVTVGDEEARADAWGDLWDCVEHEGTIDETLLPSVPVLIALADLHDNPERIHAMVVLREIATAEGIAPGHDHEQFALLREALAAGTRHLAARWRTEPPEVRRALVWLLSAVPETSVRYHALIDATLPPEHRPAWEAQLIDPTESGELEDWVYRG